MEIQSRPFSFNFKSFLNFKKDAKIYIYPNLNGLGLGLFIFFCFLISVFYENNSGLLISIVIFFVFFISIFISHQNISKLDFICKDEYLVEAETVNSINFQILNSSKEKKINIDIEYNKKNVGNYNFNDRLNFFKIEYKSKLRGKSYFNPITLKSIYPFGVMRTKVIFNPKSEIIIYPKKVLPSDELLKEFKIINIINADEFDGIDEFKNGDSFSKIAWKKSIINDKRYVKTFSDTEKLSNLILDLDKYPHIEFEKLLNYSSYIVNYCYEKKLNLKIKHKDNELYLNDNNQSLNRILKYFANVKN